MISCGECVLPSSAAPCLSFDDAANALPLLNLFVSLQAYSNADRERLASFRVIGSDGAGNPFCVDRNTGIIWLLDHEDWRRFPQFVNSGVAQLAECLLSYMGEQQPEPFRSFVSSVDPRALGTGSFWWCEASALDAES